VPSSEHETTSVASLQRRGCRPQLLPRLLTSPAGLGTPERGEAGQAAYPLSWTGWSGQGVSAETRYLPLLIPVTIVPLHVLRASEIA